MSTHNSFIGSYVKKISKNKLQIVASLEIIINDQNLLSILVFELLEGRLEEVNQLLCVGLLVGGGVGHFVGVGIQGGGGGGGVCVGLSLLFLHLLLQTKSKSKHIK